VTTQRVIFTATLVLVAVGLAVAIILAVVHR
jgi:hypothetical protein